MFHLPQHMAPAAPSKPCLPEPALAEARKLGSALGISVTVADLLLRRGQRDPAAVRRFLDPRLSELTPPDLMVDRNAAAERIARAVEQRELVAVFGDYDCDGITSCALLTDVLCALGGRVVPLLASRFDGGYGVSATAVERIRESGASLLVTCDCGSSDHDSLAQLTAAGLDVIVIDHHLVPEQPLPVLAFLNPHRPECGFAYKGLASCGLALSVAAAVRARLGKQLDLRRWLDLVAIGTIADVAPLDGDNRALVRAGLRVLGEARRPGVHALLELARIDPGRPVTGEDVAFRIAPRINAPGRLGRPDAALSLLLAGSAEAARAAGAEIERASVERRALQERMISEAVEEIEREGWSQRPAIVVGREGWNHGIVGIVAGRLASRYARPAIVIGFDSGHGRGSVRGPRGARLHDRLSTLADVLTRFGGHQAAAGIEVELERLAELRERFEHACGAALGAAHDGVPDPSLLARLDPSDRLDQVLSDLAQLEPCGELNPAPQLAIEADLVDAREVRGGHLKLELSIGGTRRLSGFGAHMASRLGSLGRSVVVLGKLRHDRWRGGDAVEIKIEQLFGDEPAAAE
jgi:single-stranded-DNA-specific exonuclease